MKNYNVLSLSFLMLVCFAIFSCQNQTTKTEQETTSNDKVTEETKPAEDGNTISFQEAQQRINQYISVYGESGVQYLEGNGGDRVMLPRFFVVDSKHFNELLKDQSETLFASMNVAEQETADVSNLIFHKVRPLIDGHLQEVPNLYLDASATCPTDCNGLEGFEGNQIDFAVANSRVNRYNSIYGAEANERFMEQGTGSTTKVLIPRYYSFSKADIQDVLAKVKEHGAQLFYVSVGAVPLEENGHVVPNTYVSDLIFHFVKPDTAGHLESSSDSFYDVTKPCPDACEA